MSCCWMLDEVSFMCMEYYKVSGCKYTTFHFGSVEYYPWTLQGSILASPECYSGALLSSSILIIHDLMITWYDPQRFGRWFWMCVGLKDLEHVFFLALSLLEIGLECLWRGGREHRPSELHLARFTWTFRPFPGLIQHDHLDVMWMSQNIEAYDPFQLGTHRKRVVFLQRQHRKFDLGRHTW